MTLGALVVRAVTVGHPGPRRARVDDEAHLLQMGANIHFDDVLKVIEVL